ncbi:MAG: hypothetical protein K5931_05720 [Lachnospiraceae bacterium]|nr:hypothetical protein [Lachnospiraceae bacterium]
MYKKLVICDLNSKYAIKLNDYINKRREDIKVLLYTEVESFINSRMEERKADLNIMGEEFMLELEGLGHGDFPDKEKLYILTADREALRAPGFIYRYSCVKTILEEAGLKKEEEIGCDLKEDNRLGYDFKKDRRKGCDLVKEDKPEYEESKENKSKRRQQARLISIYSPLSRVLKTSLSLAIARLLAERKRDSEILYINLEGYSGISRLYSFKGLKNLGDLIYDIKVNKEKALEEIGDYIIEEEGFSILNPASATELEEVEEGIWSELFKLIRERAYFNYIVVDAGNRIHGIRELLGESDKVYMPVRSDGLSRAKLREFRGDFKRLSGGEELLKRIKEVEFPCFKSMSGDLEEGDIELLKSYIEKESIL